MRATNTRSRIPISEGEHTRPFIRSTSVSLSLAFAIAWPPGETVPVSSANEKPSGFHDGTCPGEVGQCLLMTFEGEVLRYRTQVLVNAESLTTPAVSRVFSVLFYQNSDTLLGRRMKCVFFCPSVHRCHPNRLSPFTIIHSVLPTKHLFDHHRP